MTNAKIEHEVVMVSRPLKNISVGPLPFEPGVDAQGNWMLSVDPEFWGGWTCTASLLRYEHK